MTNTWSRESATPASEIGIPPHPHDLVYIQMVKPRKSIAIRFLERGTSAFVRGIRHLHSTYLTSYYLYAFHLKLYLT
jgi:hypothetical protein